MTNPLIRLGELGQSPWYDHITRDLVTEGELARLIAEDGLRGMTSNPTIFEKAVSKSQLYDDDLRRLADEGKSAAEIFDAFAVEDIRSACDLFAPLHDREANGDGTVSIEVGPALAHDTEATLAEAVRLWELVDRRNVMVKIPGTAAGIPAIERATAAGVSVNITLLFSVGRYAEVIEAFLRGLEARVGKGEAIAAINSVASFFVSRVDTKIDPLLDKLGDPHGIRGRIAIANAAKAYVLFEETMASERWRKLAAQGARLQRPLWASTSTKDPKYPDTYYVEALIAPYTVNTLPPETFDAYRDHGKPEVRIREAIDRADQDLAALQRSGIDLAQMTRELEEEGVQKFTASYDQLLAGIAAKSEALVGKG
ncbi:MAG TPA: transaldolase [Gemmatimonadales bacterium]